MGASACQETFGLGGLDLGGALTRQSNSIRTADSHMQNVWRLDGGRRYLSELPCFMGCVCIAANSQMDAGSAFRSGPVHLQ